MCVVAAVVYGVLHDQVTARVCVEYFTNGHAPIFGTDDPTLLGLGWGVIATWWVGAMLGVPLAAIARFGRWPKRSAASIVQPLAVLMVASAACAAVAGLTGAALARAGFFTLAGPMATQVPGDRHVAFIADLWAHNASYASGFIGGGIVMLRVWLQRRRAASQTSVCKAG